MRFGIGQKLACLGVALTVAGADAEATTITKTVNVGFGKTRLSVTTCAEVCVKWGPLHVVKPGYPPVYPCVKMGPNCSATPPSVAIYRDAAAVAASRPFSEFNQGPSWSYQGCGPQAIMNVLSYYGNTSTFPVAWGCLKRGPLHVVKPGHPPTYPCIKWGPTTYVHGVPIGVVAPNVDQVSDPRGGWATSPDNLADALRRLLASYGDGNFTVDQRSGVDVRSVVRGELRQGNPVILLVNGGDHWVVATGLSVNNYHVIDYPGGSRWVAESDMGFSLRPPASLSLGFGGYESNTVITIHRAP
jgi:hypothetical protein